MGWLILRLCFLIFLLHSQVINSSSSFSSNSSSTQLCHQDQSFALLHFMENFSFNDSDASNYCDESYPKMASWKEGSDCCSWNGVTCHKVTGHVIGLDLSCSCLNGTLHSNSSLFLLPHLQYLNLAYNDFSFSQISSQFGQFSSLTHLNLSSSIFDGHIPVQLSHLSKLVSLDLSWNNFNLETWSLRRLVLNLTELQQLFLHEVDMSSVKPSSLMNLSSSLISLSLDSCGLQGMFPNYIFNLPNLHMLSLGWNLYLTGYFPNFNRSIPLQFLSLFETNFAGEIPNSIGNLKSLNSLSLATCNFSGSIPASLGNLTYVTDLDLSYNHFIGEIPSSLSNLKQLNSLCLSHNNFRRFSFSPLNMTRLVNLDLSHNQLAGTIPSQLITSSQVLPPNLNYLSLSDNSLNGTIPSWVFALPSLTFLDLSSNNLSGHIPEFQYDSLNEVILNYNNLQGPFPSSIFRLVNLTLLELSWNKLSGIVEAHKFINLRNLHRLYLSGNRLSWSTNSNVNFTLPQFSHLALSSCNLSEFPNFLRALKQLSFIDLSDNKIYGEVPNWVRDMSKDSLSYLNLSSNFLTGVVQLPWNFLQYLDLHSNLFQGPLPVPPLYMEVFSISNNKLTGNIPSSICNVSSLQVINLSNNSLSGVIPKCLGKFSNQLSVLDLRMNRFCGTIPETFAKGNQLRNLGLNGNQLEGPMPKSLIHCRNLEVLDLGNNEINGTFPNWLDTLPELQVLVLRSNRFYGPISNFKTRSPFPKLRIIDLSHNEFTGLLPTKYFKKFKAMMNVDEERMGQGYMGEDYYQDSIMVTMKGIEIELVKIQTIFTTIDLSSNKFQREIPKSIGNLNSLRVFNLSHNSLTGQIPPSLGNSKMLESLDLSSNKLNGIIPSQLTSLTFLAVLNLSHNHLEGPIPQGKQFGTFDNNSYVGNSRLCGFPLSKKCRDDEALLQPPSSIQKEYNSEFGGGFGWKAVLMGYGSGMVIGLAWGYHLFLTRNPEWILRIVERVRHKKVKRSNKSAARGRGGRRK